MARSAQKGKRETQRQCAVTRLHRAPEELLRFALDPDGNAVPDLRARLPGRGVWLVCARDVLEKALVMRVFDKAFRRPVNVTENLADRVGNLLQRDCLQRLSLANKAGLVVCGFDKVAKALQKGGVVSLLHASDASQDGCRKLDRLFKPLNNGPDKAGSTVCNFNAEQLSLALGRPNVVHAALKQGGPSDKFLQTTARLERFRTGSDITAAA